MKNFLSSLLPGLTLGAAFLVSACAQQPAQPHYVEAKDNSLSFYYTDGNAERILFVSSIDRYQPHPAQKVNNSVWKATVPLTREFDYFYLVDGVPTLPDCPYTILDDFGGKNCLYVYGL